MQDNSISDSKSGKAGFGPYQSKINAEELIRQAEIDLAENHQEQFKVFLLALCGGLRRLEVNLLPWSAIDFENSRVDVSPTRYYELKTPSASDTVYLQSEVIERNDLENCDPSFYVYVLPYGEISNILSQGAAMEVVD